jgi:hypothetical protein
MAKNTKKTTGESASDAFTPSGITQTNLSPTNDSATNEELQNASGGERKGVATGPESVERQAQRSVRDPVNFRRGMFGLMASFNWDEGKFSEHPDDIALRHEALELLGVPKHLSSQFVDPTRLTDFVASLQENTAEKKAQSKRRGAESENNPDLARQNKIETEYVKNLIRLAKTVEKNRKGNS